MGIEAGLLLPILQGVGAAATIASAFGGKGGDAPKVQAPEKPPQATKQPDRNAISGANAAAAMPGGPMAGNASTFLTGAGGVNPGTLDLGKNTLLGQ